MAKARIGIRYCGGCNPHYERVKMIQWAQSQVGDRFLFIRHDQQDRDGLITVNGCPGACASKDLNQQEVPSHSVSGNGDFDWLMESLIIFEQKGTKK